MTAQEEKQGNRTNLDIYERINSLGFALLVIGIIGAIAILLLILIGGASSDSAGYHEGRVFAMTETSVFLFYTALVMIAMGAILYIPTRRLGAHTRD